MVCSQKAQEDGCSCAALGNWQVCPNSVASPKHVLLVESACSQALKVRLLSSFPTRSSRILLLHYWWTDSRRQETIWLQAVDIAAFMSRFVVALLGGHSLPVSVLSARCGVGRSFVLVGSTFLHRYRKVICFE